MEKLLFSSFFIVKSSSVDSYFISSMFIKIYHYYLLFSSVSLYFNEKQIFIVQIAFFQKSKKSPHEIVLRTCRDSIVDLREAYFHQKKILLKNYSYMKKLTYN